MSQFARMFHSSLASVFLVLKKFDLLWGIFTVGYSGHIAPPITLDFRERNSMTTFFQNLYCPFNSVGGMDIVNSESVFAHCEKRYPNYWFQWFLKVSIGSKGENPATFGD